MQPLQNNDNHHHFDVNSFLYSCGHILLQMEHLTNTNLQKFEVTLNHAFDVSFRYIAIVTMTTFFFLFLFPSLFLAWFHLPSVFDAFKLKLQLVVVNIFQYLVNS